MKADALTELFPQIPPPAVMSTWARLTALMRGQPRVIGLAPAITLTLLIGWVDWVTGWELSMFIFYAIPIVLAVWWSGGQAGLFMAIFSGVVCWIANKDSHTYETELGYSWAMLNREGYFCVVAFAVNVVRRKQDDDAARIRMLEELRQLEKDIVRVSEHEQQRIGQDLHDGLCQQLAAIGRVFGLGISMHSNSHMGISLAAMTHVGMTLPNLSYASDTHYPWQEDEVIEGGKLVIRDGQLAPTPGPGLGVKLDRAALARLHQNYVNCGITHRDDASEMRKHRPDFNPARPRF